MMYSVILPTYNERQNLPLIIFLLQETAQKNQINLEVIIVQDSSPDHTYQVANKLQKHYSSSSFSIRIITRPKKLGLGSAYRDGLKQSKGQFIFLMDADLSHHPKYMSLMLQRQKETNADIVTGSRYAEEGGVEGWTFFRKLTSRTANFITSLLLKTKFSDLTGSFRLYRKSVLQELIVQTKTTGYSFQMEILILGEKSCRKIEEVPIIFVDRLFGKSKLGPNQVLLYLKGTFQLFLQY